MLVWINYLGLVQLKWTSKQLYKHIEAIKLASTGTPFSHSNSMRNPNSYRTIKTLTAPQMVSVNLILNSNQSIKSPTYTTICVMPLCQRKRLQFCKSRITSKISVFIPYIKIQIQIKSWLEQWHEIGTWSNIWVVLGTLASSSATTSFPFPCFFPSFILLFYKTQLKRIKIFTKINQLLTTQSKTKGKNPTFASEMYSLGSKPYLSRKTLLSSAVKPLPDSA